MRRIIISGIPATGKTTLGNYIEEHFGFRHFNVESEEADPSTELGELFWSVKIPDLIDRLGRERNIVITWGFTPDHDLSLQILRELQKHGSKFVWLTADEHMARTEFERRKEDTGRGSIEEFHTQVHKLKSFDLRTFDDVTVIEAINENGRKPLYQIYLELP